MESGYIYSITNKINGKRYIGQTFDFNVRKNSHIARLSRGTHHNDVLNRAWVKYGQESFTFEVIETCAESELNERENYYIKKHNSMIGSDGYNLVTGGRKYRKHSEYVRSKMSEAGKGRVFTEEHKKRIGLANIGKKMPLEIIHRIREIKAERKSQWGEKNGNAAISDKTAQEIIIDMLNGAGLVEIQRKHDVTESLFYNLKANRSYKHIMPEHRNKLREEGKNKEKYQNIIPLYMKGLSQNEIAKKLHVSRNTIRSILMQQGISTTLHKNQFTREPANMEG